MSATPNQQSLESPISETGTALKRGWTTGACATAATKAALQALLGGGFPDPVEITLPKGQTPSFALATEYLGKDFAEASVIKDAGDDPDVTHGARIISSVRLKGQGVTWKAGAGVGIVTREGLPIKVGEASVTPIPRRMMRDAVTEICTRFNVKPNVEITLSIPGGENLARETLNSRLGVVGGLSILGTTGIVIPYSCSSWIHSIHRGIDVARAAGLTHVLASTGNTSETAANARLDLPDNGLLDMGDFAGGVLKYMAQHPIPKLTIAGGIGKLSKLAQGHLDLHSKRSSVDTDWLRSLLPDLDPDIELNSAAALLLTPQADQAVRIVSAKARDFAQATVGKATKVEVMMFDRKGKFLGKAS